MIESSTILDAVQVLDNLSCCDRKIIRVLYNSNRSNITVSEDKSKRSNVSVPTGEKKKITNNIHERSGEEETEPEFNKADDCNVLLVVDKGVGKEEIEA